jgi:predicted nuclease with TOPRIM domain
MTTLMMQGTDTTLSSSTQLLERIRNGYADEDEIKSYLKTALKNETSHERNEIMQKLREAEAKGNVYSEAVRQKISENQIERLNNRSEKMEEELHKIKETQEHLEDRIDEISDEITEHKNRNGRDD